MGAVSIASGVGAWSRWRLGDFGQGLSPLLLGAVCNVGPLHWENRRLHVRELRRLFPYPDEFAFAVSLSAIERQVGDSVPPLLAQRVAEQVAALDQRPAQR